jgi:hypothetical protein
MDPITIVIPTSVFVTVALLIRAINTWYVNKPHK